MAPKVSVIVPVYNVEQYLDRCIQSLLNQTLKEIEIILVDDESPDKCPQMCDRYAQQDSRIKIIHKKNEGLGMARNSGIEIASGEYVTFCDSDDFVESETYACVYNCCKSQDLDMCCFQHQRVTQEGIILPNKHKVTEEFFEGANVKNFLMGIIGKDAINKHSKTYGMSSCMAVFRRSIYIDSGVRYPSERLIASEDLVFLLYFLPHVQKIKILPNIFYNYTINPSSISQNYSAQKHTRLINLLHEVKKYCDENFEYNDYKNHYFTQLLRIFKIILKHISLSNESFIQKMVHLSSETKHPLPQPFYQDPISQKYGWYDNLYIFAMKHHLSLFFIILYHFKR